MNRPVGRHIAAAAFRLGATPNQVTAVSAMLSAAAILLVATVRPVPALGFAVAFLLAAGFAFDSADGQLARLTGTGSAAGEWLDHVVDSWKTVSLHLAVLVAWYRFSDLTAAWLLVPLGFTIVATVFFFAIILAEQLRRRAGVPDETSQTSAPVARSLLVLPADYGLLCLSFALLGFPTAFAWWYGALFACNTLILLAALRRWHRRLASFR